MQSNIRVVLYRTSHPGNIGAAARAMKTMGLSQLVLVAPDRFPDPEATARASGAEDVLLKATTCETLDEAISGCGLVVGTSARLRSLPGEVFTPREGAMKIYTTAKKQPVALVFGREDSGLSNEALQKCHYQVHIPVNPEYQSLNLAAAVQVLSYEILLLSMDPIELEDEKDIEYATAEQMEQYFQHLETVLTEIGFLKQHQPSMLMARLRRFYNRARVESVEYNILRGILKEMQKHL